MHIICFFHTATIIFYLPILGNQNLHPAYFSFRLEHSFLFRQFFPNQLASRWLPVGAVSLFRQFFPNLLASRYLPVGAVLPIPPIFPQPTCFSYASGWSFSSYSANFSPTNLLLDGFRLGQFFPFRQFLPNLLASRWLPVGAVSLFRQFFPNLLASRWLPVGAVLPIPPIFPQPARKQACSDACAWLVAPDNPAGFRLHITGTSSPLRSDSVSVIPQIHAFARKQACSDACAWGIITQKSPRAMWSSAGLLEKGVDYKFHVREFMFRCG